MPGKRNVTKRELGLSWECDDVSYNTAASLVFGELFQNQFEEPDPNLVEFVDDFEKGFMPDGKELDAVIDELVRRRVARRSKA